VRDEGESKDPDVLSFAIPIRGVLSMKLRENALIRNFRRYAFSGSFGSAPLSAVWRNICGGASLRMTG
jgi:hypothetical protein